MTYTNAVLQRYPEKVEDLYRNQDNDLALATYVEFAGLGLDGYMAMDNLVPFFTDTDGHPDWTEDMLHLSQSDYEEKLVRLDDLVKQQQQ
ncbi:hypothetical protein [Corynebacterium terpenotabidum]|uniref:Uncharacterized protein n=1 Tax=Corynebacterium terpenotabidum Y-11 TaxID=1200352 RepID=S4XAD8_9CORY|nr:hypothetical protein [Corynebacterium terpenotabidum]AGP30102.1 hypothetical protein A606_02245 [Corynebacterium terpenotabidum Y-11]